MERLEWMERMSRISLELDNRFLVCVNSGEKNRNTTMARLLSAFFLPHPSLVHLLLPAQSSERAHLYAPHISSPGPRLYIPAGHPLRPSRTPFAQTTRPFSETRLLLPALLPLTKYALQQSCTHYFEPSLKFDHDVCLRH